MSNSTQFDMENSLDIDYELSPELVLHLSKLSKTLSFPADNSYNRRESTAYTGYAT